MTPLRAVLKSRRALVAIGLLLALGVGWYGLPWLLPLPPGLAEAPVSPVILDRHGRALHRLTLPDSTRRQPVSLPEIPRELIDSTLAAEDKRFYQHGGIDLLAVFRSAWDWARRGRPSSGASTITQQLVKLSSPPARRDLRAKWRESLLARRLEMSWPKARILEAYFNRLDYGHNRIGPAAAAGHYFAKPLDQLSLAECALLAGLPQAPSRLNPRRHPEAAVKRRAVVLQRLSRTGKYPPARMARAQSEKLVLDTLPARRLAPWLPALAEGSPRTTLEANLQADVEALVHREIAALRAKNVHHAAAVVIDNPSGEILALVSSADWNDPRGGQINGALVPRSPGSALKPFTYLLSFETVGHFPGTVIPDVPTRYQTLEGANAPENFDRTHRGPVTIRQALASSLNAPAMRELNALGGPEMLADFLKKLQILDSRADPLLERAGLGLTIGNVPVSLLSLTNAYATIARSGKFLSPRLFLGAAAMPASPPESCFSARSAWLVADILADPVARAPSFGRNSPLELPFPCAVKTGTSSDFRDNWCLGFTRRFTVGVWAGNFDNSPMMGVSGVDGAGPIFHAVMLRLHQSVAPEWLPPADDLREIHIDPRNGLQVGPHHPWAKTEFCPADRLPPHASPADYDEQGRAILDATYAEWLASSENRRHAEFASAPNRSSSTTLRILAPIPRATYLLDPELPNGGRLHLATNLPGLAQWHSNTLELIPATPEPIAILQPGEHVLEATDPRDGSVRRIPIRVKAR